MEIISAKYIISSATYKQCPKPDKPEFAFIGRSNVGKSSLINMLCNKKGLAKTSGTPGKTQLINHFEVISTFPSSGGKASPAALRRQSFGASATSLRRPQGKNWYLVDLPGYGYATVSQKSRHNWSNMIDSYIRKRENLVCLFVLIDSRHEPQTIDIDFVNKLGEDKIPFALVFTKSDKNKPGATVRNVTSFLDRLAETWDEIPTHFVTSAIEKTGRKELLEYISDLNAEISRS